MNNKSNRMKITRMKKYSVLLVVLVALFTCSPLALAQSHDDYHPQGIFHLQFVLFVSWGNETQTPISPGETREVNLTVGYVVTHGAYWWRLLLRLLDGSSFPIRLAIENKSDWCEIWFTPENLTGIIQYNEWGYTHTSLFIHVHDDAPGNFTMGWIKVRASVGSMKGPFQIITLIDSFEQHLTITFVTAP